MTQIYISSIDVTFPILITINRSLWVKILAGTLGGIFQLWVSKRCLEGGKKSLEWERCFVSGWCPIGASVSVYQQAACQAVKWDAGVHLPISSISAMLLWTLTWCGFFTSGGEYVVSNLSRRGEKTEMSCLWPMDRRLKWTCKK